MPANFEPLHSAHAIEQVLLGVQFQKPLDDAGMREARVAAGTPPELPGRAELRGFALQAAGAPRAMSTGFSFTRMRADGTEEAEFQVQRHLISFRTMLYTRWSDISAQAYGLFSTVLPVFLQRGTIAGIALNYVDKFISSSLPPDGDVRPILQRTSPYLAPRVFESTNLWHTHSGAFSRPDDRTRRLIAVNVDYITEKIEERDRTALVINSTLTDAFNQNGYEPLHVLPDDGMTFVKQTFERLHQGDKEVLRSIITGDLARRIALDT